MNRVLLALAAMTALTGGVFAQSRPSIPNLSCAEAARIVATQGAAVLNTGTYTFDRFVSSATSCDRGQSTIPAFEAARDNPRCFVGYRCGGYGGGTGGEAN